MDQRWWHALDAQADQDVWSVLDGYHVLHSHGALYGVGLFYGGHSAFHGGMEDVGDVLYSVTKQYKMIT